MTDQTVTLVSAIAAVIIPAFIAFLVMRYRAKIAYDLTVFHYPETTLKNDVENVVMARTLSANRLRIQNFGLKTLKNVELHLDHTSSVVGANVSASSISKNAVLLTYDTDHLRVAIPEFPPNERVDIFFAQFGWIGMPDRRLKGTSGDYKIVDLSRHELNRRLIRDTGWTLAFGIIAYLIGAST